MSEALKKQEHEEGQVSREEVNAYFIVSREPHLRNLVRFHGFSITTSGVYR
jgi:hypothetical protein